MMYGLMALEQMHPRWITQTLLLSLLLRKDGY